MRAQSKRHQPIERTIGNRMITIFPVTSLYAERRCLVIIIFPPFRKSRLVTRQRYHAATFKQFSGAFFMGHYCELERFGDLFIQNVFATRIFDFLPL